MSNTSTDTIASNEIGSPDAATVARFVRVLAAALIVLSAPGVACAGDASAVTAAASTSGAQLRELPWLATRLSGSDARVEADSETWPWIAIGRLNREIGGHCTAVLIGPKQVLTAAHCLYNA